MSATVVREKRQVTLPEEVCEAAGLETGDRVDWHFEDGSIQGRKIVTDAAEELDTGDVDPETLLPRQGVITADSIAKAIRAARERQ